MTDEATGISNMAGVLGHKSHNARAVKSSPWPKQLPFLCLRRGGAFVLLGRRRTTRCLRMRVPLVRAGSRWTMHSHCRWCVVLTSVFTDGVAGRCVLAEGFWPLVLPADGLPADGVMADASRPECCWPLYAGRCGASLNCLADGVHRCCRWGPLWTRGTEELLLAEGTASPLFEPMFCQSTGVPADALPRCE
ncbi:unnamed protein product [Cuscuta epithymum]|uniref:Uncharacterized protein n=1 Tax=Cuscuta epithymum TaxID=186058 RepID=A0AAV0EWM8_9ASTE|nr:unnamed protein product [Cuscuta epithymum]